MYYQGPPGLMVDLARPSPSGVDLLYSHGYAAVRVQTSPYIYANNNPTRYIDPSGLLYQEQPTEELPPYLQRLPNACAAVAKRPSQDYVATVRCMEGRLQVELNQIFDPETKRPWDKCVLESFLEHERAHIKQFDTWCPGWCADPCSHNLKYPLYPRNVDALEAECAAYKVQRDKLLEYGMNARRAGCRAEEIIKTIKEHRSDGKRGLSLQILSAPPHGPRGSSYSARSIISSLARRRMTNASLCNS